MPTVLVIDDDCSIQHLVRKALQEEPAEVIAAGTAAEGMKLLSECRPDVVLLDIMLPNVSGLDMFEQIQKIDPKLPLIFVTSMESSETAIRAMTMGAFDYLLKPLTVSKIQDLVRQALKIRRLMNVPVDVPSDAAIEPMERNGARADILVGRSIAMQEAYKAIGRVAPQDVTVLIRGESGTGKELVARAVYQHSPRANNPFMAVNCAAIPDALLESELFGHEKGAFTGAGQQRIGKFEQCQGGTLFLDEIGDMSPIVQSKVLRVLQSQEFERVGGNQTIQTDVRVIAATNRDLEKMIDTGEFRSDLYYRLSGFTIQLAPLRERREDMASLLENFLAIYCREFEKEIHGISPEALEILSTYSWPGNVRELQNVVKQTLLRSAGPVIVPEFLPDRVRWPEHASPGTATVTETLGTDLRPFLEERLKSGSVDLYADTLAFMERYLITRVLLEHNGNQSKVAKSLGITRGSLRKKIRALKISIDRLIQIDEESSVEELGV